MSVWRVYAASPLPVNCRSERAARRLARKYRRLGITVDLYEADGEGGWTLRESHLDQPVPAFLCSEGEQP